MLPTPPDIGRSLAGVLPECARSIGALPGPRRWPSARSAVTILVDGLGALNLAERRGHARFLVGGGKTKLRTVFPSTTAAALTSLTTGTLPGAHGFTGYSVVDPDRDRVFSLLSGWADESEASGWQPEPTVFERVAGTVRSVVVGPARYAHSGFTRAVLRGADYIPAGSIAERVDAAQAILQGPEAVLLYLYIPELDQAGHQEGWQSGAWTARLELVDAEVQRLVAEAPADTGIIVTADHGMVDVPEHARLVLDRDSALFQRVRHVAGEPRMLQLHMEPGSPTADASALARVWDAELGSDVVALSRAELVASGALGPVSAQASARLGDVVVAARSRIALYASDGDPSARAMVGQHGSFSDEEMLVPLLRFGAFAA